MSTQLRHSLQHITWELTVIIPVKVFCVEASLSKVILRGNFYKCGDAMPKPSWLSYFPIKLPNQYQPNFHRPDAFGALILKAEEGMPSTPI